VIDVYLITELEVLTAPAVKNGAAANAKAQPLQRLGFVRL